MIPPSYAPAPVELRCPGCGRFVVNSRGGEIGTDLNCKRCRRPLRIVDGRLYILPETASLSA